MGKPSTLISSALLAIGLYSSTSSHAQQAHVEIPSDQIGVTENQKIECAQKLVANLMNNFTYDGEIQNLLKNREWRFSYHDRTVVFRHTYSYKDIKLNGKGDDVVVNKTKKAFKLITLRENEFQNLIGGNLENTFDKNEAPNGRFRLDVDVAQDGQTWAALDVLTDRFTFKTTFQNEDKDYQQFIVQMNVQFYRMDRLVKLITPTQTAEVSVLLCTMDRRTLYDHESDLSRVFQEDLSDQSDLIFSWDFCCKLGTQGEMIQGALVVSPGYGNFNGATIPKEWDQIQTLIHQFLRKGNQAEDSKSSIQNFALYNANIGLHLDAKNEEDMFMEFVTSKKILPGVDNKAYLKSVYGRWCCLDNEPWLISEHITFP